MAATAFASELAIVRGVADSDYEATERFLKLAERPLWIAVSALEGTQAAGQAALLRVLDGLKAEGWARLKKFDGRSTLATFLPLAAREILIAELPMTFQREPQTAWPRFERYFARAIRRRVSRRFPRADAAALDDRYQDICIGLLEKDYHRIRAFDGRGYFEGYVIQIVDRLLIDLLRAEKPRRRLPAAIKLMPALEQSVFVLLAWHDAPNVPTLLVERLRLQHPDADACSVKAAIESVYPAVLNVLAAVTPSEQPLPDGASGEGGQLRDLAPDPENALMISEAETAFEALLSSLTEVIATFPDEERAYLEIFLSAATPVPPREIARLLARPVAEIYQLRTKVMRRLAEFAQTHKNLSVAVFGFEE